MFNSPQLFKAKVFHKRLSPKENKLGYKVYYYLFNVKKPESLPVSLNKFGSISYYEKDHGAKDGTSNYQWAIKTLKENNINFNGDIYLLTMPRILGYAFNPVSFWFCIENNKLKAVLNEVCNTFSETHTYICYNKTGEILKGQWLEADKVFHVSPFLERKGQYKFSYSLKDDKLAVAIDYYDEPNNKKLITTLTGKFSPLTKKSAKAVFWKYPLVTIKVIVLIHYQALKLFLKGIKYNIKPKQLTPKVTKSDDKQ